MTRRPWEVRRSPRHGRGVFAIATIPEGTRIIEYTGELISEAEGERRYPTPPDGHEEPEHTYLLTLDEHRVIDANVGGNAARTASKISSGNRMRLSREPPYSSSRRLESGDKNSWRR